MPKFISAHVTSCMTRQDLQKLMHRFMTEASDGVKNTKIQCDMIKSIMLCEWEAPDSEILEDWLMKRNVRFRSSNEWIMQVHLEAVDGKIGESYA